MVDKFKTSEYLLSERKEYSLYVLKERAIPSVADGLKSGARRVLWTARNGKSIKTANLAGATLPLHPHQPPEGSINTLTAPYGNNIPLFKGTGAFGTLIEPTEYGSGRYTSVELSKFTEDVMFSDIELVPMRLNYDSTLEEPVHFLPLVPTVLLNPVSGIAVGFACDILPRALDDIIVAQLTHLKGKQIEDNIVPKFLPIEAVAVETDGNAYTFHGEYEKIAHNKIRVTQLPYGIVHAKFVDGLNNLIGDNVQDVVDNSSKSIDIEVTFTKGFLTKLSNVEILKLLGLINTCKENLCVVDFCGTKPWSPTPGQLIKRFTDWRLSWYVKRYQRLLDLVKIENQRYRDILVAIENNVGGLATQIRDKSELVEVLTALGIIEVEYISQLPVYRFTEQEKNKVVVLIKETDDTIREYISIIEDPSKQKKIYIKDLEVVLKNYSTGKYNTQF